MKAITLTIEITDEEFEALKKIKEEGCAEFRDEEHTWEEYEENHKDLIAKSAEIWTKDRFLRRNFHELKKEVLSLYEKDLVEMVDDAWHLTFQISELGIKFLK